MQFVQPATGWQGFVQNELFPLLDLGVRRFMLWMPHGTETKTRKQLMGNVWRETNLRYDAWRLARKNLVYNWFTTGFAEAFRPLTAAGVEIIAYVGTLHGAPEFDPLPPGQAMWEAVKVIAPILDAKCSIAFDTAVFSTPDHYVYNLISILRLVGFRCYIEPTPMADGQHWFTTPCVVSEDQWVNVINPANWNVLAAPNNLSGEIMRGWFSTVPSQYSGIPQWYHSTVPAALAAGHTCCLPLKWYLVLGGTIDELLA